ncbi:MAG: CADD family putative folate metabolism protein [Dehalococcoidia bacterium]|nr:CADD family putative folate metabolism protein [Dehalococcoidia bacterium]
MTTTHPTLEERIQQVLAARSLLKHPFYQAWSAGTLPIERLQEYARQYFHFEAAFPTLLSAIHTRTEDPEVRQHILDNLWDEEHGERNHRALWLDFAEALGVPRAEVEASTPNTETRALVDHFRTASREAPIAEALAAMFAYEGQVPDIAWEKIRGLREHYGFSPKQFEFFSVHLVADVAHSGTEMALIEGLGHDEDRVVAAVEAACDRLYGFLDGCYEMAAA